MSFLAPAILLALPLIALPLIIHLVNQRRFQTVQWAAMRFLLAAKLLSRGYSRLRQWLILCLRTLAVAALVLAVARPLSRGWLSGVGGERASAIVLLDRSPSMSQATEPGGESKLAAAKRQVAAALDTLGTGRVILLDSVSLRPLELSAPGDLERVPEGEPAAAPADLPRMLLAACGQAGADVASAGSIWICSDQRAADWKPADGAWRAIRGRLTAGPRAVRVNLLAVPDPAPADLAVRVTKATYEPTGKGWELFLDLALSRQADTGPVRVPVGIELGGARSTVEIDLAGTSATLGRHAIAIDPAALSGADPAAPRDASAAGWGRVSIPADSNPADNEFFFTFGRSPVRKTLLVAEDPQARRALELAAGIAPDKLLEASVESADPDTAAGSLDGVALVLWQAALPEGAAAARLEAFLDDGGEVLFMPPQSPGDATFAGIGWGAWSEPSPPLSPTSWRADEGLLASTLAGTSLPVGEVRVARVCAASGEGTALASLSDGSPLLLRAARDGVSFLATTPAPRDSDLAAGGIVLYALVQRAIDRGIGRLSSARQADAGTALLERGDADSSWRRVAGTAAPSSEAGFHGGVFESRGRLVAVNRPAGEDAAAVVPDDEIDRLFDGTTFNRVRQRAGAAGGVVEEVWRTFLVAMLLALAAEGMLSLPAPPRDAPAAPRAAEVPA